MSKQITLALSLMGLVFTFSSCKKERTCECTTIRTERQTHKTTGNTTTDTDAYTDKFTKKATKKEMIKDDYFPCVSSTEVYNSSSTTYNTQRTYDRTCTLK